MSVRPVVVLLALSVVLVSVGCTLLAPAYGRPEGPRARSQPDAAAELARSEAPAPGKSDTEPASGKLRAVAGPRGIFALSSGTRPLPDAVFTDVAVTGLSLRATWAVFEPREREFAWAFDREIERAARVGKKLMLRVNAGSNTPDWVFALGAQKFEFTEANPYRKQYGEASRTPVPWDPVFLAKWKQFIKAFGERYSGDERVVLVHMAGPSKSTAEMHLPRTPADREQWTRIGYSRSKLVGAWQTVIDAYAEAFPNKYLALNVAMPVHDDGVVEDVLAYGLRRLGSRFAVQHNALSAKTRRHWPIHARVASYRDRALIGFQLVSPATPQGRFNDEGRLFGGTMAEAFRIAHDAGARYVEIYPPDLKDPAAVAAFRDFTKRVTD